MEIVEAVRHGDMDLNVYKLIIWGVVVYAHVVAALML